MLQPLGKSTADCAEFMCDPLLQEGDGEIGGFKLLSESAQPVKTTSLHEEAKEHVWQATKAVLARVASL